MTNCNCHDPYCQHTEDKLLERIIELEAKIETLKAELAVLKKHAAYKDLLDGYKPIDE